MKTGAPGREKKKVLTILLGFLGMRRIPFKLYIQYMYIVFTRRVKLFVLQRISYRKFFCVSYKLLFTK